MQGGTRGFLRGRVANDLYQVTTNDRGRKVQLVRAVEESRINNNTVAQAMARMQMALCMGALSSFKEIVDHSFEGVPYGQNSIARFVSLNIPLLQNDCREHWNEDYLFNYPMKGVSAVRAGSWIMSTGSLDLPSALTRTSDDFYGTRIGWMLSLGEASPTMATVKRALGLSANDYITHCAFGNSRLLDSSRLVYSRCYLNPKIPDHEKITTQNVADFFLYEGNVSCSVQFVSRPNHIVCWLQQPQQVGLADYPVDCLIISRWNGRVWQRNNSRLTPALGFEDYANAWASPSDVFQTWFPGYNPDVDDRYPL